ncbi:DMT family transporter [Thalassospira sp.]|uniref:DMT family transporter n=1 Tax=Thalassospira sp. TaxID=1912094 RepID=UPI002736CFA2|nr:DMT family transporter [Thalassospira sp.]MDP2697047.1 DMT family transporter [Thalassospira sp.]
MTDGAKAQTGWHGGWFVLAGVTILSPDALLVRLIGADEMTTAFWRLLLLGLTLLLAAVWRGVRRRQSLRHAVMPTRDDMLAGAFYGGTSLCFILSIKNTDVANTLVIIAATPLIAGLIGVFLFRRQQALRTWIASIVVFVSLAVIVGQGLGGVNMKGDLLALGTAVCLACYFNVLGVKIHIDSVRAMMAGAFLATAVVAPMSHPAAIAGLDFVWLLLLGCLVLPLSFTLISRGAKHIPAAEVGLIMLAEAIFGSILVWIFIGEVPTAVTFIAGGIVIATLALHSLMALRDHRQRRKIPTA